MIENKKKICPTCRAKADFLTDWKFSGFNDSIFNYTANFYECKNCGLVYIQNITDTRLAKFYSNECDYHDKGHFNILSVENIKKYQFYKKMILEENLSDISIADIGCGRGGFLLWLEKNDWKAKCFGVDVDYKSIPEDDEVKLGVNFIKGSATSLPFEDDTQVLLSYFHVLEHIKDIDLVLSESNRVLKDNGYILIEVPDASRYDELPVGTAFWFGIREHIYHFSPKSLESSFLRNGFEILKIEQNVLPTPEFEYPSLLVMAKKTDKKTDIKIGDKGSIASFLKYSKDSLQKQADQIIKMSLKDKKLVLWGCSAELFSLLPLLNKDALEICDSSKLKQQSKYQGLEIIPPKDADKNSILVIAPYLHSKAIKKNALELGWTENDIVILK
ncbi:MAG: class I SAM-dependent methyltransferase [Campylobacterota bacterium]|nr:class I SAM-dependent methyltransferase [Campylobacterota bacterium]